MIASRNVNIVTKHINLNDKEKMSGRLIPVTADEENINEIQTHIDKLEAERDLYYQALCDIESGKDVRMILERVLT